MKQMKYLSISLPLLVVFPACSGAESSDSSSENETTNEEADETDESDTSDEDEDENTRPDGGSNADESDDSDETGDAAADEPEDETSEEPEDTSDEPSDDPENTPDESPNEGPSNAEHFFLPTPEPDNTAAPHIRIDAQGGIHAAYPTFIGGGAYYAYCAPDCDSQEDVKVVRLETELTVLNALIDLDTQGRPRVLLSAFDRIYYAECNENCTEQNSWQQAALVKHDNALEVTGESFAVDPEGNPHFILHTYVELYGVSQAKDETHYVTCKSDCTNADSWLASRMTQEIWEGSALRFDKSGNPHVFGSIVRYEVGVPEKWIPVYATCSQGCETDEPKWSILELDYEVYHNREKALSMRPATSLELTSDGAPRLLSILEGPEEDERMVTYLECDEDCTEAKDEWSGTVISNHKDLAAGIDLALDKDDRPRVVYNLGYSIFTASCDSGSCATAPTEWAIGPVELTSEMPPDEIILWPNCNVDTWFLHQPNLAITPDGRSMVGYQASDISGGGVADPDPNQSPCLAGTDMSWTRMTTL